MFPLVKSTKCSICRPSNNKQKLISAEGSSAKAVYPRFIKEELCFIYLSMDNASNDDDE